MSQVTENPKGGCVLAGINSVLGAIDRVCPIYHSGPGCCMQTTAADQGQSGHKSSRFVSSVSLPSTNMLEKEVVFGGTEKLRTTVQGAIDIIDADAYFVLTGCTAGIIGDDIVSVTEEFQDKGYSVYPIETPGFVGDSNLGYETVWTTMINQVIEEDVPKDDKLVNIFGIIPYHDPFWSGALEEIDRILSALGLKVNTFFTKHQGIETIRKCSGAALNIIINPWLFKGPAKKMEQKFCQSCGMPIDDSTFGKETDGSKNEDYCHYCYADGHFTKECTMDEMIELNLNYIDEFNKDSEVKYTVEEARKTMKEYFPQLKRWKQ